MAKKIVEEKKEKDAVASPVPEEKTEVTSAPEEKTETPKKAKTKPTESVKPAKKATTMEELMSNMGNKFKAVRKGEVVEGIVTAVTRKLLQVDIGGKTEGIVTDKEFEAAIDFITQLKPGDKVSVYVVSAENERGQTLLSLKRAAMDQKWDVFHQKMDDDITVEVKGIELNKGGMIVLYEGIRGFVPTSQFGKSVIGNLESLLNTSFPVKIIEVDKDKNRLIFSERHVSEEALMKQKSAALDAIKVGETYEGIVSGVLNFGAFVTVNVPLSDKKDDMAQIEGLVHISEISWEKVDDPNTYLKVGDKVKVKVLGLDPSAGKLNLSIKQLGEDPWAKAKEMYPEGTVATGTVSRIAQFGIFVRLDAGIDGLVHISKISSTDMPRVGEEVSVTVENVDPQARRMSLSLTPTEVPIGYK